MRRTRDRVGAISIWLILSGFGCALVAPRIDSGLGYWFAIGLISGGVVGLIGAEG